MSNIPIGTKVTVSTTKVKKGRTRKNGEVVPDQVVTTVRSGVVFNVYSFKSNQNVHCDNVTRYVVKLYYPKTGYHRTETFQSNEVTAEGTNPLFIQDK